MNCQFSQGAFGSIARTFYLLSCGSCLYTENILWSEITLNSRSWLTGTSFSHIGIFTCNREEGAAGWKWYFTEKPTTEWLHWVLEIFIPNNLPQERTDCLLTIDLSTNSSKNDGSTRKNICSPKQHFLFNPQFSLIIKCSRTFIC